VSVVDTIAQVASLGRLGSGVEIDRKQDREDIVAASAHPHVGWPPAAEQAHGCLESIADRVLFSPTRTGDDPPRDALK
jgi:hypothetical protein